MATASTASDLIRAFNRDREAERVAMKYKNMAGDAFVFLRGTAHLFHQRYAEAGLDKSAPAAWCCNDLHLENFGSYLGDNDLTYFDVNDFDEACLAPVDWDLVRLVTSLLVAASPLGIPKPKAIAAAKSAIAAYASEIAIGKPRWLERRTATGPVGALMDALRKRDATAFLDKRTVLNKKTGVRGLAFDKKMLPLDEAVVGRADLNSFFDKLTLDGHPKPFFRMLDAGRRVAGTGSLGLPRFAVLVEGDGTPDKNVLLDLKAAAASTAAAYSPCKQPDWKGDEAVRVVTLQSRVQAVTPAFLQPVTFQHKPFILKMLQPTTDRLDLSALAKSGTDIQLAVNDMAALAAWGHLRASGRQGSATADDLMAAAGQRGFAASVLDRAQIMAKTVEDDFAQYKFEYAAGRFTKATG